MTDKERRKAIEELANTLAKTLAKNETKPGGKTTEFWLTAGGIALAWAGTLVPGLEDIMKQLAPWISTILGSVYTVQRGYIKGLAIKRESK